MKNAKKPPQSTLPLSLFQCHDLHYTLIDATTELYIIHLNISLKRALFISKIACHYKIYLYHRYNYRARSMGR